MAKKKDPLAKKKHKLDLGTVLFNIDTKNRSYYANLTDEERKAYSAFVLMRFMSCAPDQNGLHEYFVQAINDIVNVDFWVLSKHPELCHMLLCICGLGKKNFHPWIAGPKRVSDDKIRQLFKLKYPDLNDLELKILYSSYSDKDIQQLCFDYGMDKNEVKQYVEVFKKATS